MLGVIFGPEVPRRAKIAPRNHFLSILYHGDLHLPPVSRMTPERTLISDFKKPLGGPGETLDKPKVSKEPMSLSKKKTYQNTSASPSK